MRRSWVIVLGAVAAARIGAQTPELPRPVELEPDIRFWTRVYTEIDTRSGFIHDSQYLGVVYRTLRLPEDAGRRARNRVLRGALQDIRDTLQNLAGGARTNLTREEQRVLALWPDSVSDAELLAASKRLRFQLGQSDRFRAGLVRAGRWKPYIEAVLAERGLPRELVALPHVESSFDPTAYSKVGAAGMWQFTRSTGLRFMRIDHVVDERRDPFFSTEAAAKLLENNYEVLQSWPLAITAYNHGQAGMRQAVRKLGTDRIEVILRKHQGRTFGFASRNFYVAFLAAVDVDADPEKFFGRLSPNHGTDTVILQVPDYVTVDTLRSALDVRTRELRAWNPALMEPVWSGDKFIPKGFKLRLPAGLLRDPGSRLAAMPDTLRYTAQKPDIYHRVQRGDTISEIADRYRVSATSLVHLNNLRSRNFIRAGQVLRLPGNDGTTPMTLAQLNGAAPADVYVVRAGDSIDRIARTFGVAENVLLAQNGIVNADLIYVGQELRVAGTDPSSRPIPVDTAVALAEESAPALVEPLEPEAQRAPLDREEEQLLVAEAALAVVTDTSVPEPPAPELTLEESIELSLGANVLASEQAEMAADPSDYLVADDGIIQVQALETLGHYGDWLEIRTQRLRDINGMPFSQAVVIGQSLKLDFSQVDPRVFEERRVAYQRRTQEAFFLAYRIKDTRDHVVRSGESLWVLALREYRVPVWLLRQYNPDLDLDRVRPGTVVKFPELEPIAEADAGARAAI